MEKGKVYIAGAGPGDIDLVSIKTMKLIKNADVIVYDRLAENELLKKSKVDCELIYVGKEPKNHILNQYDICMVLIKKAKEKKSVLRLKGGDPFIFGRGAEEAYELFKQEIPFEIVPGISSFYSVPAYAGIPITHRDFSSSFHVYTGHFKTNEDLDYNIISKNKGTLVFIMSVSNIKNICDGLIKNGKNENTPVAFIQWGTTYKQKSVIGTLKNICTKIIENGLSSPAVFVVGDVVKCADNIKWLESKPLWSKKVLITRPYGTSNEFIEILSERGAFVSEFPTIKIEKPESFEKMDKCIKNIKAFTWLFFTSSNAVESFFERMKEIKVDIRSINHIKIFCIGNKTKQAVENKGIFVNIVPKENNSIYSYGFIKEFIKPHDNILFPVSEIGGDLINKAVLDSGAKCSMVTAYTNKIYNNFDTSVLNKIKNGFFDALVFASSSQAENFFKLTKGKIGNSKIVSIGNVTSNTLEGLGISVDITAENPSQKSLAQAVEKILNS